MNISGASVPSPDPEPAPLGASDSDSPDSAVSVDVDGGSDRVEQSEKSAPRRRRWWAWGLAAAILVGLVAAFFLVPLPYYLIQPGSVRPAEQRIDIEGAESYHTDGEVLFTTVLVTQATPALLVRSVLDDAVEVRSEAEMYPDGDKEADKAENVARMDLSKLVATRVALDYLGIEADYSANGARVLALTEDSPATGIIRPGDVIVGVDGGDVTAPNDIATELDDREPGDSIDVTVLRSDDSTTRVPLELTLGGAPVTDSSESNPDSSEPTERPILGVSVEPFEPAVDSEVSVQVDSGKVSGPSAGLAWTLAIIDRMTPASLTDGRRVAVTGEILDDGSVGIIGGIAQKVAAVKRAGVDVFLYPAGTPESEQREMRKIAGDDVELRPVATIDEAVEVLSPGGVGN